MKDDTDTNSILIPMVAKGSWISKLPPALMISSANLRVQDTIGQGKFAPAAILCTCCVVAYSLLGGVHTAN